MNISFYSLWFDTIGIQTRVYRFNSRRFIHAITDWLTRFVHQAIFTPCLYIGGQICPLFKNCLISDRSKIFCLLKLLFVKFFSTINILRLKRHESDDDFIKTSKSL